MTDSTGTLSETHSSSSNEPTETQLAETGDKVQVTEPALGTTIQVVAAGDSLQLNFDPADVAKVEVKDGNLEVTFKNGGVAVIQGYEEWAAAGGQPTGPQGGVVDVAQLGQPGQTTNAENQAPACEIPNAHVVDVPVPADGERLTLAVAPGDALRLACSFRDVHGTEAGHNLEMTFPGGGVVVVENFSEWIAAKGATISDCVCGGVNPAEFIIALGLNPEDVLPAADGEGPAGALPDSVIFAPGQPPQILHSYDHPHILPPTALGYGAPNPEDTFEPIKHNDLGGPVARDDNPDAELNVLTVHETTDAAPILLALAAASGGGEGGENGGDEGCVGPIGPQVFHPDRTTIQVLNNDSFGPDKGGNPPITAFHYTGDPSLVDNPNGVLVLDPAGDKLVITSTDPNPDENQWHAELIIDGPHAGEFTFFLDSTYLHDPVQGQNDAFQHFSYTIQDSTGDKASANITVDIVDSVPVANNDCAVCITEGGEGGAIIPVDATAALVDGHIVGNVMANDDKGADQFLPDGTKLITFTYTADDGHGNPVSVTVNAGTPVETFLGGHLTVNDDGSWTYTPPAEVDNTNGDPHDDFSYTIQDGDGDTSSATQPICIQDTVEPPDVTMTIAGDATGSCVQEDSKTSDDPNQVTVHANAQGDDHLTQLVIDGFTQKAGWTFDLTGLETKDVNIAASDLDASDGKITLVFNDGVTSFNGTFGVQPPANTDVDLGTLTATATAAAADDASKTLDSNTTLDVTVDANADPVHITAFAVSDTGGDGAFAPQETGTLHIAATFGDSQDGSETHTVVVNVPSVFDVTDPAGATVVNNPDGSHTLTFTLSTVGGSDAFSADVSIQATNAIAQTDYEFTTEAKATETTTGDDECDTSDADNIATDTSSTTTHGFDDHPTAFDNKQCVNEGATQNVMIIADVSGSMDDTDISQLPGFQTRLQLEKDSLTSLVNQYAALDGTVTITLIAFASGGAGVQNLPGGTDDDGARNLGTFTFSNTTDAGYLAAIAAINSLAIGMQGLATETEYDDALILAQQVLGSQLPTQTEGTTNTVYFLSDGVPNPLSNGADATTWKSFVNTNNIEVVAVGIGADVTTAELDKVEDHTDKSVVIDDTGDLAGLLTNTAGNSHVSGNVLLDPTEEANISPANDLPGSVDTFGNDGAGAPPIVDLVVDGVHYTENSAKGGDVLANDGAGTLTIQTDLGGILQFNLENGDYTYTSPDKVDQGGNAEVDETFTYTIQDKDGDTDPANLVICIKDNVEPPTVTMAIGVDGKGECVEEDSLVNDPDNKVAVHAAAQNDDTLTHLVITGFNNEPGWTFDLNGLKTAGVNVGASDLNASDGTITLVFNPGVKVFDGTFGVQPPANTDVDLGTLTAVATAAASGDPTQTLDSNTTLDVTVDANADAPTLAIDVNDSGDANSTFQSGETGTVHVTATFGDFTDGSELHTVSVNVPDGFTLGALNNLPAGVTTTVNGNDVVFTLPNGTGSLDYTFNVTNANAAEGPYSFTGQARAEEKATEAGPNGASGDECDSSAGDNIATADAHDDTTVTNVGTPTITVDLRSTDACIEEDSTTATSENNVDLVAHAQPGDVLVNLVVTGFDPGTVVGTGGSQPTWLIDISALTADTTHVASAVYNTGTDTLTITFKPGVTDFTGSFAVAPPKDSDVDLGTLTGTVKAADASDPTLTATSNSSTVVNVDANADAPTVALDVNDSGDANTTFQQNETGTVHVTATFGDFQDGSEIHTVLVDVPDGFTVGSLTGLPAGVTAQIVDTNNVLFTVAQGTGSLDYTFNVTNTVGGTGSANFSATATANENPPSDEECDTSNADNIATAVASDNPGRQDDTPTIVPASVTVDDDDTPGFNGGATDTVDPPNASATANLNANFGVDAPGTVIFGTNPNPTVTSHGEAITYTQSADHKTLTATADAGGPDAHVVYTAVINNDGTYTFTLLDALDHAPGGGENDLGLSFAVTATDKDGDSTGGTINVTVNDDSPISTGGATGTVEEDNLPGGHDENAGINLTTTGSIGINFGADGPGNVTTISYTGPALTSGGAAVTFGAFDPATHSITASAGGHTVFTVSINPTTGQYTFTLAGPLDHPAGGGDEQAKNLTFGFTATDFDGDPVNGNFAVDVRDDVPLAANDPVDTSGAAQTINIMIVFDKSGSMDEDPNVNGYSTRIDLARAAVAALLDTYGSFANVNVQIVDFSTDATAHGWMTIDQANAFLATLTAGGTTDYHDALTTAATAFNTNTPDADRSVVYFLSDGKPTADNGADSQLGAADITTWQTFAHNDSIEQVFAIGIGNGIPANDANLEGVAFLDANHDGVKDGNSSVVVTENLLLDTLVSTVSSTVSGNVLTNDQFGADGAGAPKVTEIVIGTHHLNSATAAGNLGDIQVLANAAGIIVVHTGLGGDLTFNFNTGDFTYHAPNTNNDETFQYTIVDKDGDTSTADLTFLNTAVTDEKPHTVFGDNGNNNLNGQETAGIDIIGGDDGNDTASGGLGNDHITGGAGADNLSGGGDNDIIIGGSRSEVTDQPGVTRADDGNDTLHGDAGNDTLIGNEGDDILQGGAGNDSIIGGPGNDLIDWSDATGAINHTLGASGTGSANLASVGLGTDSYSSIQGIIGSNFADTLTGNASDNTLQGGHGDDVLDGGGGNDTFNYTSVLDGHDVINNFDSNNTGGTDVLNLDALFDSLGLATANRHVSIAGSGTTTVEVNADTNNDGTFDLHVATLHTVDTGAVAVGTEILVGTA